MKNFINWGLKVRKDRSRNYYSVWENLKTTRLDLGEEVKLPYGESEFYDIGVTERCNAMCNFCYVSADSGKQDYRDICETWKSWMASFPEDTPVDLENDPVFNKLKYPSERAGIMNNYLFLNTNYVIVRKKQPYNFENDINGYIVKRAGFNSPQVFIPFEATSALSSLGSIKEVMTDDSVRRPRKRIEILKDNNE